MLDRRTLLLAAASVGVFGCDSSERSTEPVSADGPLPESAEPHDDKACAIWPKVDLPRRTVRIPGLQYGPALMSPDGRTLLAREYRSLLFASTRTGETDTYPALGPEFSVMSSIDRSSIWSSDSRGVWFVKGETDRPAGWTVGPLSIARQLRSGRVVDAPRLRGLPGRLGEMTWVDGDGLGIAHVDTRGSFRRPELPDTNPALAVVDAADGRVRTTLALRKAINETWGPGDGEIAVQVFATVRLRDGRVRAIVRCVILASRSTQRIGGLAIWTEGEPLRKLAASISDEPERTVFGDSGETILVRHGLSASGVIYEHRPSPPPTPMSGQYAGLYDLNGREIWSLEGTATAMGGGGVPAVRADGDVALIALPEQCGGTTVWGVVDMANGNIRRRLRTSSGNSAKSAGFHRGRPWLTSYRNLDFF